VLSDSSRVPDLWIYPHDTVGPRIQNITATDSMSALVTFTGPLDPYQRIDSSAARLLLLPDSTPVPVHSLLPKPVDDSIQQAVRATQDTTRKADSAAAAAARKPVVPPRPTPRGPRAAVIDTATARRILATRPVPFDKLVLRPAEPFAKGGKYVLEIRGVRNINRVPADVHSAFAVPKTPERPVTDSTGARPDSAGGDTSATPGAAKPPAPKKPSNR
jgi:hypothetical protein